MPFLAFGTSPRLTPRCGGLLPSAGFVSLCLSLAAAIELGTISEPKRLYWPEERSEAWRGLFGMRLRWGGLANPRFHRTAPSALRVKRRSLAARCPNLEKELERWG